MPLPWFDLTEVLAYSNKLVEELQRQKTGGKARGDKTSQVVRRIDALIEQADAFEREQKLNFYKKAKLLASVREGLTAKDWSKEDVDTIVHQLMTRKLRKPQTKL